MSDKQIYKVVALLQGKVYELYACGVTSSGLFGFLEISGLLFDSGQQTVVDPAEERMREEFADTEVLHVPINSVLRVEQVKRRGQCVIRDRESGEKVTPFPVSRPNS